MSRSSARGSTASVRQSPAQDLIHKRSNSTASDVIDVDSVATTSWSSKQGSSNKRKVAAITVSDDEIEIVDGPMPAHASLKKTKSKAPTKTKSKKK
jgi:mediator of RNA polymerase II transcription subunit 12